MHPRTRPSLVGQLLVAGLVALVLTGGCASHPILVEPGMSRERLVERLGEPDRRRKSEDGGEVWIYRGRVIHAPPQRRGTGEGRILELQLEGNAEQAFALFLEATFDDKGALEEYRYSAMPAYGYQESSGHP